MKGWWALPLLLLRVAAADVPEQPVGLILNAGSGKLLRANTETALAARAGDLLFTGDGLRSGTSPLSYLFCPAREAQTLGSNSEVRLDARQSRVKTGKVELHRPVASCLLPTAVRLATASQQHYGVTMTRGVPTDFPPVVRSQLGAEVLAELKPFEDRLAADARDAAALAGAAAVFEAHKLLANALTQYFQLRGIWPEAEWVKSKIFELENVLAVQAAAGAAAAPEGGKTYALLVGISKYSKPELNLQFADRDAQAFSDHLLTGRGGAVPGGNILLLENERATTAAIRNGFEDFLKRRAGKLDTVFILVAGHGTVDGRDGYVLTYDSDPQDLKSTAVPMSDLQALFQEQLGKVGRVILMVDICKAGTIGGIKSDSVNAEVQHLGETAGQLLGLMASRPREFSVEGPDFGGGHGAFSYFVIKGLSGAADANQDKVVDAGELVDYVSEQVRTATRGKQHPREFGNYENTTKLSDLRRPGLAVTHYRMLQDSRDGEPLYVASAQAGLPAAAQEAGRFEAAVREGRVLPGDRESAYEMLPRLRGQLSAEAFRSRENQLRVALEDRAQRVLLQYLAGDQNPQKGEDFRLAERCMEAARGLTRESLFLEGRGDFFSGRALLFDRQYTRAEHLLESAVRLDPTAAYAYNALGVAYLEQGRFEQAIPAFRDAARRAQHWSYPLHNLALAYVETGDSRAAIRAYQQAIRLTPRYSYLPYNLGLVYQRLNRRKEADVQYRRALELAPEAAEPRNALGSLKAAEGKTAEAEKLYREALERRDDLLPARHNLALLLASEKGRLPEALTLWRQNLRAAPDYLPSRISLAEALGEAGDYAVAAEEYRRILALKPEYLAARLGLASNLARSGQAAEAAAELARAARQDQGNPQILEQMGDLEQQAGHTAQARDAYGKALQNTVEGAARRRLKNKLGAAGGH